MDQTLIGSFSQKLWNSSAAIESNVDCSLVLKKDNQVVNCCDYRAKIFLSNLDSKECDL